MPAATFVMHREPLLLLDTLVDCDNDATVCEWTVQENDAFVDPGAGVPAHVGVEYMAQCVAVHAGARARVAGFGPPLGFLLGTRQFTAAIPYFAVGQTYQATCRELIRDAGGMGSYECTIMQGDGVVASARLSVLEKERGKPL
jgi:predicted hotdog family 3-hydroxylacyl-ACP dehydratase